MGNFVRNFETCNRTIRTMKQSMGYDCNTDEDVLE